MIAEVSAAEVWAVLQQNDRAVLVDVRTMPSGSW